MTIEEFERVIAEDPALAGPIRKAAAAMPRTKSVFGTPMELAVIVLLFPVVRYVVVDIGLPWLHEVKRYSELWRQKFHQWVDEQYREQGLDPEQTVQAGETLRRELEKITDEKARKAWERLAERMKDET